MKTKLLLLLTVLGTSLSVQSQTVNQSSFQPRPVIDLNFAMGFPTGTFAEATDDIGFGVDIGMYFPVSKQSNWIKPGGSFTFLGTGSSTQNQIQTLEITINGQVIDVIEIPMRIVTSNSIIGGHAVLRGQAPVSPWIEPYMQAMVGFRVFSTDLKIYDDSFEQYFDTEEDGIIYNDNLQNSWVFSFGGGAGVQIKLKGDFFLNLGANFLYGTEAEYYTKEDIRNFDYTFTGNAYSPGNPDINRDDLTVTGATTRSKTSSIQTNIGVTMMIKSKNP
ncbi:MAG: hypothetical protein IT270_09470 [Saprospiraceae bacterium]|nr:hypothetical protein [Saprospiraceae bacterium]